MGFQHSHQKVHMLLGMKKAAASPRTPAHLRAHLQKRVQGGGSSMISGFPIMRQAPAKQFKRKGMVVNPILDEDNIDSGMSSDEGNESELRPKNGSVNDKMMQAGEGKANSSVVGGGLRNVKAPMKVTNGGPRAMVKPLKVTGAGPRSPQAPRKAIVGRGPSKPMKVTGVGPRSEMAPMSSKAVHASNSARSKKSLKSKKRSMFYGG